MATSGENKMVEDDHILEKMVLWLSWDMVEEWRVIPEGRNQYPNMFYFGQAQPFQAGHSKIFQGRWFNDVQFWLEPS